jgi:hypothetical protein
MKINFTEQKWSSLNNNTPLVVSRRVKGKIIKVGEDWWVSHNLYDPYSQIPMQLPIHTVVITSELTLDENVYFDIVFENDKYLALLVNK